MYQLNNLFYGELDLSGGDITSGATTITLSTGDVANLEITPSATDPALFTIWDKAYETAAAARRDSGKVEIIEVTGKDEANDTLTAGTRGFSNTTAQSYSSTDSTTYGIVQVSADELFDNLLISGSSNTIQDRAGNALSTINAATMLQIGGTDIRDSGSWSIEVADASSGGNTATFGSSGAQYIRNNTGYFVSFYLVDIDTTGLTGTNNLWVRGLPAPAAGTAGGGFLFTGQPLTGGLTFTGNITLQMTGGSSAFRIYQISSASSKVAINVEDFASGSNEFGMSFMYIS